MSGQLPRLASNAPRSGTRIVPTRERRNEWKCRVPGHAWLCPGHPHTSITTRVDRVEAQARTRDPIPAEHGTVAGSKTSTGLEESTWPCPIEDRRRLDSSREGMITVNFRRLKVGWTGLKQLELQCVPYQPRSGKVRVFTHLSLCLPT
jgi:hypothetical protein